MTVALATVLAKSGLDVDPSRFLTFVEDAARKLAPPNPAPANHFSADQRAVLADVGLDLSRRRNGEGDYRARAVAGHAVLAESAVTVQEAAEKLHVDGSRVRHRLKERRLTGWKNNGGWRLPSWQFTTGGVLPGLDVVLRAVPGDQPALVVAAFMSTPQDDLVIDGGPVSPREWLLAGGDPEAVARIASTLGEPA